MSQSLFRLRIQFAKQGRGAFLSHLELIHAIERVIRRAKLDYAITQGFSPHMRISFGPALSVGIASLAEYADVFLNQYEDVDAVLKRLQKEAPEFLPVQNAAYVSLKEPSLTASISKLSFRAKVIAPDISKQEVERSFAEIRSETSLEVERKGKSKFYDPSQEVGNDLIVEESGEDLIMSFSLRTSPSGALGAPALIQAVFNRIGASYRYLEITRTGQFILSEGTDELVQPL